MQKNEFERQVHQKMEDLKLSPSDSVWINIQASIIKNKRKKMVWIFLLALVICLSGVFWLMDELRQNKRVNLSKESYKEHGFAAKDKHAKRPTAAQDSLSKRQTMITSAKIIAPHNKNKNLLIKSFAKSNTSKDTFQTPRAEKLLITSAMETQDKNARNKNNEHLINVPENERSISNNIAQSPQQYAVTSDLLVQNNDTVRNDSAFITILPTKIPGDNKTKNQSKLGSQARTLKSIKNSKSWIWGISFTAGISGIPDKLLGSLDKSYSSADAFNSAIPPAGSYNVAPPKINSAGAFSAGVAGEKKISKKTMLVLGINYKMFSSIIKVGAKEGGSERYTLSNPVNAYHNYYHFVEVPVSLQTQVISKKLSLFLDAGIVASRLISSNALQVDNVASAYRKNNSLFNNTELGFSTGLYASLFSKQKTSMQIGPYIYYGATRIGREGLYKNQHFNFIGIKSQLFFKK